MRLKFQPISMDGEVKLLQSALGLDPIAVVVVCASSKWL